MLEQQTCPGCGSQTGQVKAGMNNGRQQYRCGTCRRRYVPERVGRGYAPAVRDRAAALFAQGETINQIGAALGVHPRTLRNWFQNGLHEDETKSAVPGERAAPDPYPNPYPTEPSGDPARTAPTPTASVDGAGAGATSATSATRRRVTIRDVAARAGVTTATVSNYLNNKGRMHADTALRIRAAIEELHFTPNALTRAIRSGRTRILGVVAFGLLDLDDEASYALVAPILAGINASAEAAGHDVLLYTSWYTVGLHGGVRFLDGHIDGLLFFDATLPEAVLKRTVAAGLPSMGLLTRHVPDNVGYVNADNLEAMQAIVEHLVSIGRTRIGFFSSLHNSNYRDRYQGFCEAMAAAGLTWDQAPMKFAYRPGENWKPEKLEAGLRCLASMAERLDGLNGLNGLNGLDAMVIPNGDWAARMIRMLRERGYRVPEDIAVVAFDDVPEARRPGDGMTTIRQPLRKIGETAAERLLAMIDGTPVSECQVTLPAQLIVRDSTVPVRGLPTSTHGASA